MEEKEYSNIYAIPANYTDSGKLLGGMIETRNAVETLILVIVVGYPELFWMPVSTMIRIVIMTVTIIPLAVVTMMGIDGDSLFQYIGHMIRYLIRRRKLHMRRVGYRYEQDIPKTVEKSKIREIIICAGLFANQRFKSWCDRNKGRKIHQDTGN